MRAPQIRRWPAIATALLTAAATLPLLVGVDASAATTAPQRPSPHAVLTHQAAGDWLAAYRAGGSGAAQVAAVASVKALPAARTTPRAARAAGVAANASSITSLNMAQTYWVPYGPIAVDTGAPGANFFAYTFNNVSGRVTSAAYDPTDPNILYLGTSNGGVWKSTDGGYAWNVAGNSDSMPSLSIGAVAVDPNSCPQNGGPATGSCSSQNASGPAQIIYAGTGEANFCSSGCEYGVGLYRSTDAGRTWTLIPNTRPEDALGGGARPGSPYNLMRSGTHIGSVWVDPNSANAAGGSDHVLFATSTAGLFASNNASGATPVYSHVTVGAPECCQVPTAAGIQGGQTAGNEAITDLKSYCPAGGACTVYAVRGWPRKIVNPAYSGFANPHGFDTQNGVYVSTDGGSSFAPLAGTGLPTGATRDIGRGTLGISAADPKRIYASFTVGVGAPSTSGVSDSLSWFGVSTDGGGSWTKLNPPDFFNAGFGGQGSYDNYLTVDPTDARVLYVGGIDIFRSSDGGGSWTNISHVYNFPPVNTPVHPDQHFLMVNPNSHYDVLIGNDGGLWKSHNSGNDWIDLNRALNDMTFYGGAASRNFADRPELLAGAQDNGSQLFNGTSQQWTMPTGGDGAFTLIDWANPNILYALGGGYLVKSEDGGHTWFDYDGMPAGESHPFTSHMAMDPNDNLGILRGEGGLYETLSGGRQWYQVACTTGAAPVTAVVVQAATPHCGSPATGTAPGDQVESTAYSNDFGQGTRHMWMGTQNGNLFRVDETMGACPANSIGTTPTGCPTAVNRVQMAASNLPARMITSIAVDPVDSNRVWVTYGGFNVATPQQPGHIFFSSNATSATPAWTAIDPSGATAPGAGGQLDAPWATVVVDPLTVGTTGAPSATPTIYAGTDAGFVFSPDNGTTWLSLSNNAGLPNAQIFDLFTDGNQFDTTNGFTTLFAATNGRGVWALNVAQGNNSPYGTISVDKQSLAFYDRDGGLPASSYTPQPVTVTNHGGQPMRFRMSTDFGNDFDGILIFCSTAALASCGAETAPATLAPGASKTYFVVAAQSLTSINPAYAPSRYGTGTFQANVNINAEPLNPGPIPTLGSPQTVPVILHVLPGGNTFSFAEGYTGPGFQETLSLFSADVTGNATVTYYPSNGSGTPQPSFTRTYALTAGQTYQVNVNSELAAAGAGPNVSATAVVPGKGVAERVLNFNTGSWHGSTDLVGTPSGNPEWFFAEGSTAVAQEYLTLQNPNPTTEVTDLTYTVPNPAGGQMQLFKRIKLPASSRTTVYVNGGDNNSNTSAGTDACNDPASTVQCGVGTVGDVSIHVLTESSDPIVAERPMYMKGLNFGGGAIIDGTDSFGATADQKEWDFAEGSTFSGVNEFITIQNARTTAANAVLSWIDSSGNRVLKTTSIPASSRQTVWVNQGNPAGGRCGTDGTHFSDCGMGAGFTGLSLRVTSDVPLVIERPMYFNLFGINGAHDALGANGLTTDFYFSQASSVPGEYDFLTIDNPEITPQAIDITYFRSGCGSASPVSKHLSINPTTRLTILVADPDLGAGPGCSVIGIKLHSERGTLVEKPTYSNTASAYGATDTLAFMPFPFLASAPLEPDAPPSGGPGIP